MKFAARVRRIWTENPSCAIGVVLVTFAAIAHADEPPVDIALFRDSISHWNNEHGRDRNDPRFDPSEYEAIADRLVAFQNPDGGWPKNVDWLLNIDADEIRAIKGRGIYRSTFDNRNVYPQIGYLVKAAKRSREKRYELTAIRGLDYIFNEQRSSGGWRGSDIDAITYNDDVMTGVMALLLDASNGQSPFDLLSKEYLERSGESLQRAVDATLRCQIRVQGRLTGWCQQHDHETFEPVAARSYELPAICPAETTSIVRFLMRLDSDDERVRQSIDSAIRWLEASAIHGVRIERFDIGPVRFKNHTATTDVRVVQDPNAPPVWARYYEIETNLPFFCNRDGVKVYALEDVALERRTGYAWYGRWPESLLAERH